MMRSLSPVWPLSCSEGQLRGLGAPPLRPCCKLLHCSNHGPNCSDGSPSRAQLQALAPGDVPWERPCKYELDVALEGLTAVAGPEASALSLVFLVDGSGSVTEGASRSRAPC